MRTQQIKEFYESAWYLELTDEFIPKQSGWAGVVERPQDCDVIKDWDYITSQDTYAAIGWHDTYKLAIVDFDFQKSDTDYDYEDIKFMSSAFDGERPHVVSSKTEGNVHVPVLIRGLEESQHITSKYDWIDIKGSADRAAPSWAVSPINSPYTWQWAEHFEKHDVIDSVDDYDREMQLEEAVPIATISEVEEAVTLDGNQILSLGESLSESSSTDFDYGDTELPVHTTDVVDKPVGQNCDHPFHGSSTGKNFKLDADNNTWACWSDRHDVAHVTGGPYHLIGMQAGILECGEWVGSDEHYAGKREKIKEYCRENGIEVPTHWEGVIDKLIPDNVSTDLAKAGLDIESDATIQGTARSGKSYGIVKRALEEKTDERIVYVCPTHEEGKATMQKFKQMGETPARLIGEERARRQWNLSSSGQFIPNCGKITPDGAQDLDGANQYHSYASEAVSHDIIITVPELLHKIDDYDLVIMTEESAFSRMVSGPVPVINVRKWNASGHADRYIEGRIDGDRGTYTTVIDQINEKDRVDELDQAIREACNTILDIDKVVTEWTPSGWDGVDEGWSELVKRTKEILDQVRDWSHLDTGDLYTRLQNYNRIDDIAMNTLFCDGVLEYGNDEKKQMFYVGDTDRLFVPMEQDATLWLGGNSIPAMSEFHDIVHGDVPEPIGYKNDYEPLREALSQNIIIKFTGCDNQNQQSRAIQNTIHQIQNLSVDSPSSLVASGSSQHTAEHAESIRMCTSPSGHDDISAIETFAKANMSVAIAENSKWSVGVDLPCFDMGAIYNGHFAAPREEYIYRKSGDPTLLKAERIRAAQNATLRASNIPTRDGVDGTGETPMLVPSYHVPDAMFELFEEYDLNVVECETIAEARALLVDILDMDAQEHEGDIVATDDLPPRIKKFRELLDDEATATEH